jgi:hypothetical protein
MSAIENCRTAALGGHVKCQGAAAAILILNIWWIWARARLVHLRCDESRQVQLPWIVASRLRTATSQAAREYREAVLESHAMAAANAGLRCCGW